ncbi:dihydrolipoyllysine-residue succinyltransferase component of 2-oxoglutarate dehydrogenase complex [Steroidobacter agaridevorans]|uniref:Dihydrolipoyllysine-residue succinyltransferase component of 2-oxoglutarate dehydrogenase complex n=1 Tax=Steroidobacter agaridevorans TaxID=2695856 RepID=A0A829YLK2_9GAMM|nr:2-oxoglutarate dehydrogenase complex dihydrolipoyllysine-residue succinyltransferase [Steroidobacter agaridevorans]GFE84130.1 dihydrolipoyllysine-residue succinyltransferase component of 2-oxoglutarate dehydrogenase complex [Steroidobacter agaridevorans]GFE86952.1 dihydrolipoyllysine-residue succinyltransferase component of 2-oxoglutarate dehydrogenase complex [Steroidobacter agaridevorans]
MTIEIKVPQLPESVTDATLVSWHKKPGEAVSRDENLVDLETDKVVLEVPAPSAGVIKELKVENGATVTSGQVLAILEAGEGAVAAAPAAKKAEAPAAAETKAAAAAGGKLAPAAKRMVEEHKLDATQIAGSGRDGRVSKGDVIQHMSGKSAPAEAKAPAKAPAVKLPAAVGSRNEQRVPMTRLRARIAERLIQAQSTAAMLTTFNEVDLTAVNEIRARYKDKFEKAHGVKLGFSSFFIKAAIEALRKFPAVNASIDGNDVVYHEYYDFGVAVSTERGLMVPVIRNAEALSFAELEQAVGDYAKKARDGSISLEELTGGTFTITNGGVFGSLMSTPILNPPQVAILGMHKIQERPMVVDGEIKIRPMMYLALTYDHRIVDGRESVQFLVAIKEALEDPARLLLQL